jgi:hypothetical protein
MKASVEQNNDVRKLVIGYIDTRYYVDDLKDDPAIISDQNTVDLMPLCRLSTYKNSHQ